ncbi:expressed unknown protein [Seminavis robusta]|uniref:Uncharacterized protein n=1 Tax=Seminavis robusta TaxID=568900 RepID=A0A9N8DGZ1_9STRA|nr:expressed unknown protein [Seminavis robusta]|eukprot:Sro121_g058850.1 n/a (99) ;mRNA; r:46185-46481
MVPLVQDEDGAMPLVGCLFGSRGDVSFLSTGGRGTTRSDVEIRSALSSILNEALELIDITLFDDEEDEQDDAFAGMLLPANEDRAKKPTTQKPGPTNQ